MFITNTNSVKNVVTETIPMDPYPIISSGNASNGLHIF